MRNNAQVTIGYIATQKKIESLGLDTGLGILYDLKLRNDLLASDSGVDALDSNDTSNVYEYVDKTTVASTPISQFNLDAKLFFVRTPQFTISQGGTITHYVNVNIPVGKKLVLYDRAVIGRGLGILAIQALIGTNAIVTATPLPILAANTQANIGDIISTFESTGTNIGGTPTPPTLPPNNAPTRIYLGDEAAVAATRAQASTTGLPITFVERVLDARDAPINFGFSLTISTTTNSTFTGYSELFFTEEDSP